MVRGGGECWEVVMIGTNAASGVRTRDEFFTAVWQLFGYSIVDVRGRTLGPVARVWTDDGSQTLAFVGLNTGRVRRRTHVIPARAAQINDADQSIQVVYPADMILGAPHHNTDIPLSSAQERKVNAHYDNC
jgi:PRC-barrel domain protein